MISQIPSPENPALLKSRGRENSALKKGEIFRGEVVRDLGKGEALVQSGGRTLRVATDMPLKEGGVYDFRVRTSAPIGGLPVLESAPGRDSPRGGAISPQQGIAFALHELTSAAVRAKGISPTTSALIGKLSMALQGLFYQEGAEDPVRWVLRSVSEGGMFWENRVARYLLHGTRGGPGAWRERLGNDLKGMLLEIQASLKKEGRDSPEVDAVRRKTEEAVDLIQSEQLENQQYMGEEGGWSFILPVRLQEGAGDVGLFLRRERNKGAIRFSMMMEFSSLGAVEVGGSVLESGITVNFQVRDKETADWVRSNLPLLGESLREKGFAPGPLACTVDGTVSARCRARPKGRHPDFINLVI